MTLSITGDPTKDFVIGLLVNLLILYLVCVALSKVRHRLLVYYYKLRYPNLVTAVVGIGSKWDVAGSSDNASIFLLQFLNSNSILKADIEGYNRIEDRFALQGPANSSEQDIFDSNVYLVLKDEYEFHLHCGKPLSADHLCKKLSAMGIKQLSQSVKHHY